MIERKRLVMRHHPHLDHVNKRSPLSVGNGNFAFTADITGLQTFPNDYDVPLGTQSQWGWHSSKGHHQYTLADAPLQKLMSHDREIDYPMYPNAHETAFHWLRQNPHRLQLAQISFLFTHTNGDNIRIDDIESINQELNLWEGTLYSNYSIEGIPVSVCTVCHPTLDQISVNVASPLIQQNRLKVQIRFPCPHMTSTFWEESTQLNWNTPSDHHSKLRYTSDQSGEIERLMDQDQYIDKWHWSLGVLEQTNQHEYTLNPDTHQESFSFTIGFAPESPEIVLFDDTHRASVTYWKNFWSKGGAIDFSGSQDPRASELERRVVLSQFLIDIHSSGDIPPQETGLLYNSWFGKFHLEMHWWHAANLPIWGRGDKLARSLDWYLTILPQAKELASSQGYEGARWPKQVAIDGTQSPSKIATVLIWQQPHPIYLAELCYRENRKCGLLERWEEIIVETAEFMVSFVHWDVERKAYILGPSLIPAQECHDPEDSMNPPFELEYWKQGLEMAIAWLSRLDKPIPSKWIDVVAHMAKPPNENGVYLAHENCPNTFEAYNHDHPSMVGALGILPGSLIDKFIMERTLERVYHEWRWDTAWGWDFPMCAMTATRLGLGEKAVDFLLKDELKNTYLPNGHNYQDESLSAYLPGNGGLLIAVALMTVGWHGYEGPDNPGFPKDGSWNITYEGIHPIL